MEAEIFSLAFTRCYKGSRRHSTVLIGDDIQSRDSSGDPFLCASALPCSGEGDKRGDKFGKVKGCEHSPRRQPV
jgi:hypothetical protein